MAGRKLGSGGGVLLIAFLQASVYSAGGGSSADRARCFDANKPSPNRQPSLSPILPLQLCSGITLLGLFEGYKVLRIRYYNGVIAEAEAAAQQAQKAGKALDPAFDPNYIAAQSAISTASPMGVVWVSCRLVGGSEEPCLVAAATGK